MKKLSLILLIFLTGIIITSCSNDDNNSDDNNSIIGKWQLSSKSIGGQNEELSECEQQQTMEFFTNGTVENYYVDNDPCTFSTMTIDYSKNGNNLTISIDGEGMGGGTYILNAEIETLTDNTLEYTFVSDNEDGDYPEEFQTTETYVRIDEDTNNDENGENYFHGSWNLTAANKETGENLLILCTNGELPSYTFASNNELNTTLYIGSASNVGPCETENISYNYEYNSETNILTFTNPTGNSSEYKSEIIEMSENSFKTRYISGNIYMQTTVPNFTRVYERQ